MRLIFVTVPRITNKSISNSTDFYGYFFTRKCCVWGANHSQPGDWWDTLLEQELGQGSFFRNITSPQPWSHHSRLSEHTAGQVCVHSTSFCSLSLFCFFMMWCISRDIRSHELPAVCIGNTTQGKAAFNLFNHCSHFSTLSSWHTAWWWITFTHSTFWTPWLPHMLVATNQNITDWIKMIPWKKNWPSLSNSLHIRRYFWKSPLLWSRKRRNVRK